MPNYTYGSVDPCFESMMVSFKAPLQGFHDGCRSVIGLDDCHLLGKHGGCLMEATTLDSQNGIVPLAIMVCRNKISENLHMFLKALKPHIVNYPAGKLIFILDRQKGIGESVANLFHKHNHRYYFRHMLKNFKIHFKVQRYTTLYVMQQGVIRKDIRRHIWMIW